MWILGAISKQDRKEMNVDFGDGLAEARDELEEPGLSDEDAPFVLDIEGEEEIDEVEVEGEHVKGKVGEDVNMSDDRSEPRSEHGKDVG